VTTARAAGLYVCHDCGKLSPIAELPHHPDCPRCGAALHLRKKDGTTRAWALLLAAYVMYIPANVLPVSTIVYMGKGEPDTIMSGVKLLFAHGDAPVAALLFFASICVPSLKLLGMTWLLLSVKHRWVWRPKDRTVLYRLIEIVGRWSMLDIFVISLLVALVQLQALATIHAGAGAVAFCTVVVLTMFAAESFDPRLIWDNLDEERT